MAITPKQELRQGQTLVMTPQLRQAIKLLQLSNLDLAAYLDEELEQNPLLEAVDPDREASEQPTEEGIAEGDKPGPVDVLGAAEKDDLPQPNEAPLDTDYENLYTNDSAAEASDQGSGGGYDSYISGRGGALGFDNRDFDLEQTLTSEISRRDYLFRQLNVEIDDPVDRLIGAHLIEMVDEAGYLAGDLEPVARIMGCEVSRVERTVGLLQDLDPAGMFARNLSECLALQLAERDRLDPVMRLFLDHLNLVAEGDIKGLMKVCGVDAEDVRQMIVEIKELNPKPGLGFSEQVVHTLVPDVFVRQNNDGSWRIELNNDTLPRVLVNSRYCAEVRDRAMTKEDKAYISDCLNTANWLVKSLDQRAKTILRVASELVRQQDGFFAHGVEFLRPLTLRDIAAAIDMHESTVSRVTSNKYMATPRGTFELKYFFTPAIASSNGSESHSAEAVRHRIKALIDQESTDVVLSDDKIAEVLGGQGIDIARRTVAKYREAMRIPSSVLRRRHIRSRM